jgi:predicted nucleic acid-binding protein
MTVYVDTSALVKLVVEEEHSGALRNHLEAEPRLISSALCRTELRRALSDQGSPAAEHAEALLASLDLMPLTDTVLDAAGCLRVAQVPFLRSLDALHLASAQRLPQARLVTYDHRMVQAAQALSMPVVTPT